MQKPPPAEPRRSLQQLADLIVQSPPTAAGRAEVFCQVQQSAGQLHIATREQRRLVADALAKWASATGEPIEGARALVAAGDLLARHPDDRDAALQHFERAVEREPQHLPAIERLGELLVEQGEYDRLKTLWASYLASLEQDSQADAGDRAAAWRRYARLQSGVLNDVDGAIDAYERSIAEEAEPNGLTELAELRLRRGAEGDREAAAENYREAGQLRDDSGAVVYSERAVQLLGEDAAQVAQDGAGTPRGAVPPPLPGGNKRRRQSEPPVVLSIEPPAPREPALFSRGSLGGTRSRIYLGAAAVCFAVVLSASASQWGDSPAAVRRGPGYRPPAEGNLLDALPVTTVLASPRAAAQDLPVGLEAVDTEIDELPEEGDDSEVQAPAPALKKAPANTRPASPAVRPAPKAKTKLAGRAPIKKARNKPAARRRVKARARVVNRLTSVRGARMPRKAVRRALGGAGKALERCYAKAPRAKAGLKGRILVSWSVKPNGRVKKVDRPRGSLRDRVSQTCAIRALRGTRFPRPRGGTAKLRSAFEFAT